MTEGHHTKEQVALAFAHAPVILEKMREAGVDNPHFVLHSDASGKLFLGYTDGDNCNVTEEQYALAQKLLFSQRPYDMLCLKCFSGEDPGGHPHKIGVTFCCGLVTAAEKAA